MSACRKVLWFTVWNVFFATVFSGSVIDHLSVVLDLKDLAGKLAVGVPAQVRQSFSYCVFVFINFSKTSAGGAEPCLCSITQCDLKMDPLNCNYFF